MAASPIQNQQILGPDGRWDFSNLADTVSLENFPDSLGQPTRMNGGDDQVTGSSIPIPGWFNDVNGNLGNDFLVGGTGRDKYLGGNENDFLAGDAGADWLNGNVGNDNVSGGAGNDIVRGGAGNDFVFGEAGDDIVTGDLGKDFLNGGGR
ncbi:calcium-binding protein [Synechococcus sp. CCY9202]|uniref:calcium-binding protein n=1 Tax=Synechococcus sp. CCY9202 TaxID=174698 RepID=UPI002B216F1A|nr:calcium-binding protein [Synechococcus sp. CCY9202]MEA5422555.1 calcium-binding protein [Synechococcus sp. CCY9202]